MERAGGRYVRRLHAGVHEGPVDASHHRSSDAAFVLGPEEGIALLERLDGVVGLIVTKDGRQLQTRGFRRLA